LLVFETAYEKSRMGYRSRETKQKFINKYSADSGALLLAALAHLQGQQFPWNFLSSVAMAGGNKGTVGADTHFIGFKKNVNRATTQVMMKTGHVEKTNDRDYEVEER
jgi:hypothetical protein